MDVVTYTHFYQKGKPIYAKHEQELSKPLCFHTIVPISAATNQSSEDYDKEVAKREQEILMLHKRYNARVIVINTQPLSTDFIRALQKGSLLIRYGIGIDNVPMDLCREKGIHVTNIPHASTQATIELTLGSMIALSRNLHLHHSNMLIGKWDVTKVPFTPLHADNLQAREIHKERKLSEYPSVTQKEITEHTNKENLTGEPQHQFRHNEIMGKNICLLGYGSVGRGLADICARAFNMNVTVWVRKERLALLQGEPHDARISFTNNLPKALRTADIVSIHLSLNEKTQNLLNATMLKSLRPHALLINNSRAKILDTQAVYKRLKENTLGGIAFDVFDEEPVLNPEALQHIPNALFTPHQGGNTQEAHARMAQTVVDYTRAYYNGTFIEDIHLLS